MCAREKIAYVSSLHGNTKELQSMSTCPIDDCGLLQSFHNLLRTTMFACACMADVGCNYNVSNMEVKLIRYKIQYRTQFSNLKRQKHPQRLKLIMSTIHRQSNLKHMKMLYRIRTFINSVRSLIFETRR